MTINQVGFIVRQVRDSDDPSIRRVCYRKRKEADDGQYGHEAILSQIRSFAQDIVPKKIRSYVW